MLRSNMLRAAHVFNKIDSSLLPTFKLMKKRAFLIIGLAISLLAFNACDTTLAPEVAYITIDTLTVNANASQGTSSSKLTTVWVEQNGQQLGAFIPPCTIPVLAGEDQTLRIIPGININGSFAQRNQYEMLSPKTFTWDLSIGQVKPVGLASTTFNYNNTYEVIVVEDFDGVGLNYQSTAQSDTSLLITSQADEVFEFPGEMPNKSGKFVLAPVSLGEFKTLQAFELPKFAANVWMEINYKTDVPLTFGVVANEPLQSIKTPVVTIFSNEEWNKIYINLVTEVSGYPNAIDYNLFFGAINTTTDTATILIDNIKLLY